MNLIASFTIYQESWFSTVTSSGAAEAFSVDFDILLDIFDSPEWLFSSGDHKQIQVGSVAIDEVDNVCISCYKMFQ